ncbi:MAG: hypothetical protein IPJ77_17240 [Planctomycetes bacterium]|nr:hypothetical protein [Planctomycetota bacterium]
MSSSRGKNFVLVAALLAACAWVLLHRARSWWDGAGRFEDGAGAVLAIDDGSVRHAAWGAPRPVDELAAGVRAPVRGVTRAALSHDGRWVVFAAGERGLDAELYLAERAGDVLLDPRPILALNTPVDECAPAFSDDTLWFASDRAGGAGGLDLWRARFRDGAFEEPERLPDAVQSAHDDTEPGPSRDGTELAFATDRDGRFRVLLAASAPASGDGWSVAPFDALDGEGVEREPCFGADGRSVWCAIEREGAFALHRSLRVRGAWRPAAPIDTEGTLGLGRARAPCPEPDGFALWCLRAEPDGALQLVRAPAHELHEVPARPWTWVDTAVVASLLVLALAAYLARRWPALELIYKCLLVSVLLHLLLLLLFQYLFLQGGSADVHEPGRIRVRYVPNVEPPSARVERDGRVELDAPDAEPARAELAADAPSTPSDAAPLVALPEGDAARAPERAALDAEPGVAAPRVAVEADVASQSRRGERAPELALPATEATVSASDAAPARAELETALGERAAPSAESLAVDVPDSAAPRAPARTAAEPDAAEARSAPAVAVARPSEPGAAPRGGPAAELELEFARSAAADSSESASPARAVVTAARSERDARPRAVERIAETPGAEASPTPARAPSSVVAPSSSSSSSTVAVEAPAEGAARGAPERAQPAPSLALDTGSGSFEPERSATPTRAALPRNEPERGGAAPSTASAPLATRVRGAPESAASGRRATEAAPGASNSDARVALAAPVEMGERAPRGERAPELELDAGDTAGAGASDVSASAGPERRALPSPDGRADVGAPTPGALALEAPRGAAEGASRAPARAGLTEAGAPSTPGARSVAIDDDGAPAVRAPRGATPTPDLLADVVPSPAVTRGGVDSERPARAQLDARAPEPESAPAPASAPLARVPDAPERAPSVERRAWDHTPYENRSAENKARALELHGGDEKTEEAVARGLAYLARVQQRAGNWGRIDARDPKYGQVAVGKTGLALLAFLGAGHTHASKTEHSATVARALAWLASVQDAESGHFGAGDAYSHGIATYALAECLAMTRDDELRPILERAVRRILAAQDTHRDPRLFGGWSYYFADGHAYDRWPRTSITAWQVMALESARLSGLEVPDAAFEAARAFLAAARDEDAGAVRYSHDPERLADRYSTLPASTPAGMFALSLLGSDLSSDEFGAMRRFVLQRKPDGYRYVDDDAFVFRGTGNLYFWYYGTLAMFRAGGASWATWNEGMKRTLVPAQAADGSWEPIDPYARYARDDARDKSYTTALCVLSLEVYYRYYLPLLRVK